MPRSAKRASKSATKAAIAVVKYPSSKRAPKLGAPRRRPRPVERNPEPSPEYPPERLQFLAERFAHYDYIITTNANVLGPETHRQDTHPIYVEAYAEFCADPSNPACLPKDRDMETEAMWFALCDEKCQRDTIRLHEFFLISFSAFSGLMYLSELVFPFMPREIYLKIMNASQVILKKRLEDEGIETQTPSQARWSRGPPNPNGGDVVGPHLIGQKIRYNDELTGKIAELTVRGYEPTDDGNSYFDVAYSGGVREKLSANGLRRILIHRIP
ncbi:hypothetical protein B0H21DRAFT_890356 [Amylocystis lapponica]|nr:hypothetical protein B0H21DRAFT_890356 [Amylocystis lapponica]